MFYEKNSFSSLSSLLYRTIYWAESIIQNSKIFIHCRNITHPYLFVSKTNRMYLQLKQFLLTKFYRKWKFAKNLLEIPPPKKPTTSLSGIISDYQWLLLRYKLSWFHKFFGDRSKSLYQQNRTIVVTREMWLQLEGKILYNDCLDSLYYDLQALQRTNRTKTFPKCAKNYAIIAIINSRYNFWSQISILKYLNFICKIVHLGKCPVCI